MSINKNKIHITFIKTMPFVWCTYRKDLGHCCHLYCTKRFLSDLQIACVIPNDIV